MIPCIRMIRASHKIKQRQSYWIRTFSHPLFYCYKNMFYKTYNCGKWRKIIPKDLANHLTPRALAYWYMDDGHMESSGFRIATHGFSWNEHLLLKQVFLNNLNISITIRETRGFYYIYIPAQYKQIFSNIIKPYILPCFKYKLPQ